MEWFDAVLLARIQFAFTISFHIIFPAFTIGLASFLAVLEGLWLYTKRDVYLDIFKYWLKIFAVAFAMGVVSGVVMSYQFGTNWGPFAEKTAPVLGPLLAYEVLTAFFLEAGFLGVMLFGLNKVGPRLHFAATVLVAVGTLISAFWILSANSWMQTPAAYLIEDGRFIPESWLGVIFNPSFPYRFVHMVLAAFLTTSFVVGAVAAFHLLKDRTSEPARIMFAMAVIMAAVVAPIQIIAGDQHGLNTQQHQPAKVAAMEGNWDTGGNVPLLLFALPDEAARENRAAIAIPNGASLILTHKAEGVVPGLNDFITEEGEVLHPPVAPVFYAFRVMVGTGVAMLALSWVAIGLMTWRRRGADALPRPILLALVPMTFSGWVATLAGWYTTEIGRQPWLVTGLMTTEQAVADVPAPMVATTLAMYLAVYAVLLAAYIGVLFHLARKSGSATPRPDPRRTGLNPIPAE